ncbi:MAG: hypothetical protein P4L43_18360 [Syntrophobacteraceae bacterium]|nr:hypothetical protein [Syntrophobacteraceae bacterium]
MSKFMQIDVRLLPIYGEGGLKKAFPDLFGLLDEGGYNLAIDREPSLYEMVEVMIRMNNDPHVHRESKQRISQKLGELQKVRDEAREALLGGRLKELDRLLYRLEDLFEAL